MKLTVGEFYGPNQTIVNHTGVTPNVITDSNPIYAAHYDALVEQLKYYKKMSDLLDVPTTKQFTINFNKQMQLPTQTDAVQLVKLGTDQVVEVTTALGSDGKQIIVTPTSPLQPGAQYVLLIHPKMQDISGVKLKNGYHLKVTVQSKE